MKKSTLLIILTIVATCYSSAQTKRALTHDDIEKWKRITETSVSDDGKWVAYKTEPWRGDQEIFLYSSKGERVAAFNNATGIEFTADSRFILFKRVPGYELVRSLKLKKTKKEDMPGDTLVIYSPAKREIVNLPGLVDYKLAGGDKAFVLYRLKPSTDNKEAEKVSDGDPANSEKKREQSDKNGYTLSMLNPEDGSTISWPFVKSYVVSSEKPWVSFVSSGDGESFRAGLYSYGITDGTLTLLMEGDGEFTSVVFSDDCGGGAFLYEENPKKEKGIYRLYTWSGNDGARVAVANDSDGIPAGWIISSGERLRFSRDGGKLFFGTAPKMPEKDTLRLDDEYPNVDIWHGTEGKLHTVQVLDKNRDLRKAYLAVYHTVSGKVVQLADRAVPDAELFGRGESRYVLLTSNVPYELQSMWESSPLHLDLYLADTESGERVSIARDVRAAVQTSPGGKYVAWYCYTDSSYYSYSVAERRIARLSNPGTLAAWDEMNDVPNLPEPYRPTGWLKDDAGLLVNDRYDIWSLDLTGSSKPVNMTLNGRESNTTYSYIWFDREEQAIDNTKPVLLSGHNDVSREDSYYTWDPSKPGRPLKLTSGQYSLSTPVKAKSAETVVYSKGDFKSFPDLLVSDIKFRKSTRISNVNPQQEQFLWGSAELVSWTSLDGLRVEGLLYKPENFDPSRKYPMIVNFYEKSSQELYDHRIPELHRSTIDYHYYTSNGYLVFNPDVYYEDGYPGESAFNCVMPGITSLIARGFVDEKAIGAQGHSWGGYQVAYLATRTDLFAAIESGAPVVNMFSAYGGIRWWTGLNRAFQYEHTQSRIGATIWESPLRYLENSPLFTMDKVTTPILIMHNDADGHVPWYQGIEYFIALRRLQKPVWMLNYTGEPHWPQELKNKKDFQIRLSQFFNHYLKGEPMPRWMEEGVPVIMKEHDLGYDLMPGR